MASQLVASLSLMFVNGERPDQSAVQRFFDVDCGHNSGVRISHVPDAGEGWLELLSSGLTFDLLGLEPANSAVLPPARQFFGFPQDAERFDFEAIVLRPGPHIAAAGSMMPVVRVMTALAAQLVEAFPVQAVCWEPAQSWMEPKYFSRIVETWIFGGAFPALGLVRMERDDSGTVTSECLSFFVGQEVRVAAVPDENPAETVKRAVRLADHLVRNGPLTGPDRIDAGGGTILMAEPSRDGRFVDLRVES